MFQRIKKLKPSNQAIFALLVGFSLIAFWRGTWGLMDIYLFPNNPLLSSLISIFVGFVVLTLTHYWTKEIT